MLLVRRRLAPFYLATPQKVGQLPRRVGPVPMVAMLRPLFTDHVVPVPQGRSTKWRRSGSTRISAPATGSARRSRRPSLHFSTTALPTSRTGTRSSPTRAAPTPWPRSRTRSSRASSSPPKSAPASASSSSPEARRPNVLTSARCFGTGPLRVWGRRVGQSAGGASRAWVRNPVCATMRWSGRTAAPSTYQPRFMTSSVRHSKNRCRSSTCRSWLT